MSAALAFMRAGWLSATSYRINALLSLFSFAFGVVPIYFIAGALEPVMANAIAEEGAHYFAFLVVGLLTQNFIVLAMSSLPAAISRGIGSGTLEAMLATPIKLPTLMFGLISYEFVWTIARSMLFLAAATVLGMRIALEGVPAALLVFVLLVAAHVPIGLLSMAGVLAFRNPTPLARLIMAASAFLGGMYYPAHVVPSWLQYISGALPMTYGLRAFRETLLGGASLGQVGTDFLVLILFVVVLMPISLVALRAALRYARVTGSLAYH